MVQRLPPTAQDARPAGTAARSMQAPLSSRLSTSFSALLRPGLSSLDLDRTAPPAPKEAHLRGRQLAEEMSDEGAPRRLERDLAPDEQPRWGHSPENLAELFACLSAPVGGGVATPAEAPGASPAAAAQVAELVERWARRVSLGGDQRRGVARLDLAEGRYAGAQLLVSAEGTHVAVELTLPESPSDSSLSERIRARLAQRGLSSEVTVR
jgi:hypothetical protein